MKVRIKTEEQFIRRFGKQWRDKVLYGFYGNMDKMLGKIIDIKRAEDSLGGNKVYKNKVISTYSLSEDMFYDKIDEFFDNNHLYTKKD